MKTKKASLKVWVLFVVFFILILSIIFIPTLLIRPHYDFLYSNSDSIVHNQGYLSTYTVKDGHIVLISDKSASGTDAVYSNYNPPLFIYKTSKKAGERIDFNAIRNLDVNGSSVSVDGYVVKKNDNASAFNIFNPSGNVISKYNISKKLDGLNTNNFNFDDNFKFIGWIKQM